VTAFSSNMNLNLVKSTVTRKEDEPVRTGDIYIHCYKVLTEAELHTYIYIYIYIYIYTYWLLIQPCKIMPWECGRDATLFVFRTLAL